MAYKINRAITVNGSKKFIRANSEQEYALKVAEAFQIKPTPRASPVPEKHDFKEFALNWFDVYSKPNVATVTATTYRRQLNNLLIPFFENIAVEDITTDDIQRLYNQMGDCATETKKKTKMVLNQILELAVDKNYLQRNPMQSKLLKIGGKASTATEPYTVEQMQFLVSNLDAIIKDTDRMYLAIQALHPLRLEEVLGLKWEDVDTDNMVLHIRRAVTHPTRNQPEIKPPKTKSSSRTIDLSTIAAKYLKRGNDSDFVIGGEKPFSWTQSSRMFKRIQKNTGFSERITPLRFRTTTLTDIYDNTKDIKFAQSSAGHTSSAMTLKHYVKGRQQKKGGATVLDTVYCTQNCNIPRAETC